MRSEPFSEVSKAQRRSTRAHSTATTTAWDTALGGGAGLVRLRELGEWCVFDMLSRGSPRFSTKRVSRLSLQECSCGMTV